MYFDACKIKNKSFIQIMGHNYVNQVVGSHHVELLKSLNMSNMFNHATRANLLKTRPLYNHFRILN